MKILHVHIDLSLQGGAQSVLVNLANEMSSKNEVSVCALFQPEKGSLFYNRLNRNVNKTHLNVCQNHFISSVWKIYKYFKSTNADIIHLHGLFYYYAFSILLLHYKKTFVYTVHSDARMENAIWDKRILWFKRLCFRQKWLHPITISSESKDSFTTLYGCDSKLIINGVAKPVVSASQNLLDQFKLNKDTLVFVHPGRISKPKNQVVLCKVFQRLISEGNDVVLLIAGTKQDKEIYKQIESLLSERICYLGERNDVPQLLYEADAFCLPSIWEGLPITLLEALSVGCIPICSPVGGIVNVVESGVNGFLSSSSSFDDYYEATKQFLTTTKEQRETIRTNCIKSFEPYRIEHAIDEHLKFYNKLLSEKK